jgi:gas vesicle protein
MKFKTGFFGFLIGALAGAAVGLLYAPQTGDETRQILVENSQKMKENALESIQEAQDTAVAKMNEAQIRIDAINKETKDLLGQLKTVGQNTLENQKSDLEEGYEEAKEAIAA